MQLLLLVVLGQTAAAMEMLSASASDAQLMMQAENLQAMWLDYKSSEQELHTEHDGLQSSLMEIQNRISTTAQAELAAKRNSAKVLEGIYMSLEAAVNGSATLAVDSLGQVQNMDEEKRAGALEYAGERLMYSTSFAQKSAESTADQWNEAFINSEDGDLRTAVAEAEDAFRHLTGQRVHMNVVDQVQEFFRSHGVKTNTYAKNVAPVTRQNLVTSFAQAGDNAEQEADAVLKDMDKDHNGKITWKEAEKFFTSSFKMVRTGKVASLAQLVALDGTSKEEEAASIAQSLTEGMGNQLLALDAALVEAAKPKPAALIQKKAEEAHEEKKEQKQEAHIAADGTMLAKSNVDYYSYSNSGAMAMMREQAMASLAQYVDKDHDKDAEDKLKREKRWAKILERQQSALIEQEKATKAEEKELSMLEREEQWLQSQQAAKVQTEVQTDACAGQKSSVRALITASQSHATCLKSQLGACVSTEVTQAPTMRCDEPSAGWQKKCLADKAKEMIDCAPNGVDWKAMRRGEVANMHSDNAALDRLSEWCTFHRALGKIEQHKAAVPFSLILSSNAAISKDAVAKLSDFGENFKGQEWDFLQVDPVGSPAPLHSVIVKSESAGKIRKAMSSMKAAPLDLMPKAMNDNKKHGVNAIAWNAGVSGMLQVESNDCSLHSPALVRVQKAPGLKNKLVAQLR